MQSLTQPRTVYEFEHLHRIMMERKQNEEFYSKIKTAVGVTCIILGVIVIAYTFLFWKVFNDNGYSVAKKRTVYCNDQHIIHRGSISIKIEYRLLIIFVPPKNDSSPFFKDVNVEFRTPGGDSIGVRPLQRHTSAEVLHSVHQLYADFLSLRSLFFGKVPEKFHLNGVFTWKTAPEPTGPWADEEMMIPYEVLCSVSED